MSFAIMSKCSCAAALGLVILSALPARGADKEPPFGKRCCGGWVQALNLLSGNRLSATVLLGTDVISDDDVKERWLWRWEVGSDSAKGASLLLEKCRVSGVAAANIDPLADCPGWLEEAQAKAGFGKGGDQPLLDLFPERRQGTVVVVRARQIYTGRSVLYQDGKLTRWKDVETRGYFATVEIGSGRVVDKIGSFHGLPALKSVRSSASGRILGADDDGNLFWCVPAADGERRCKKVDTRSGLFEGSGDSAPWLWPTGRDLGQKPRNPWRPIAFDALVSSPLTAWVRYAGGVVQALLVDIETGERKGAWEASDRIGVEWMGEVVRAPSGELLAITRRPTRAPDDKLGFDWISFNGSNPRKPRHVTIE